MPTSHAWVNERVAAYPLVHQWIPYLCLWYREGNDEWYVQSPRATYADVQKARAGALADQARAKKRHWFRAYHDHSARLAMLDRVLETFGPLMAQHPTMTLAEACGDPVPKRQLPGTDAPNPLRRVKEL